MRFFEIQEARKNPEKNVKSSSGRADARSLLSKVPDGQLYKFGVSMTHLPKLGVNPVSKYNTPIGIYYYPASHYIEKAAGELEFQDKAPYINVFKINTANILDVGNYSSSDLARDIESLKSSAATIEQLTGIDRELENEILTLAQAANKEAAVSTPAGHLWFITRSLALSSNTPGTRKAFAPRHAVVWNKILRLLGYDVVMDFGNSIIHPSEPTQGVVLNPKIVEVVGRFSNERANKKKYTPALVKLFSIRDDKEFISQLSGADTEEIYYLSANQLTAVGNRIYSILNRSPDLFAQLDPKRDRLYKTIIGKPKSEIIDQLRTQKTIEVAFPHSVIDVIAKSGIVKPDNAAQMRQSMFQGADDILQKQMGLINKLEVSSGLKSELVKYAEAAAEKYKQYIVDTFK